MDEFKFDKKPIDNNDTCCNIYITVICSDDKKKPCGGPDGYQKSYSVPQDHDQNECQDGKNQFHPVKCDECCNIYINVNCDGCDKKK